MKYTLSTDELMELLSEDRRQAVANVLIPAMFAACVVGLFLLAGLFGRGR